MHEAVAGGLAPGGGRGRGLAGRGCGGGCVASAQVDGCAVLEAGGRGVGQGARGGVQGVVALEGGGEGGEGGGGGGTRGAGRGGFGFLAGDEFVEEGVVGFEAAVRVPAEAAGDEVEEGVVVAFEGLLEGFGGWAAAFAF